MKYRLLRFVWLIAASLATSQLVAYQEAGTSKPESEPAKSAAEFKAATGSATEANQTSESDEDAADETQRGRTELSEETKAAIEQVIEIGRTDNRVQQHLDYLCNRIGPRLTGSEGLQAACEWAEAEFKSMGLESRLEKWGDVPVGFERGPAYGAMISPKNMKLEFGTNSWSAGTRGRVTGRAVMAPKSMDELEAMRDQLKGAYVMIEPTTRRRRRARPQPPATPAADKADAKTAETDPEKASESSEEDESAEETKPAPAPEPPVPLTREQQAELMEAITECEPAGFLRSTRDDLILTGGSFRITMDDLPKIPSITLLKKQWDDIHELVKDGAEVDLAFDIRNHFRAGPIPLYNVIADIPGTEFPDEYVVVGGHIDSWDGATGATDNGAGCATTMEAARILMAANVKPRRTIRFMLWSGEEQGLLGSRAYVEEHREEVNKSVSAVFVHDGGTNYVAGIRCTEAMRPDFEAIFEAAMTLDERTPFEVATVPTIRPRGGSDHVSFIRAGVPGFFWTQRGRATYRTTHHTQYDTFETVVPEYQKHSAIVIAIGALGTANLDYLLPRDGVEAR